MKLSKQERGVPTTRNIRITECQLTSDEKTWLEKLYYRKYPEYKSIIDEYEFDKARNKRLNNNKKFPDRGNWKPSTRSLPPSEEILLCGPSETVTLLRSTQIQSPTTSRLLTYSSMSHDRSSRICSSYVSLNHNQQQQCRDPQFYCITKIFWHKFGDKTMTFAKATKFGDAKLDHELGMWYASIDNANDSALYLIDEFSEPLTVALDIKNSFIWFLNYK